MKTFVAPAIGGPFDGKLLRSPVEFELAGMVSTVPHNAGGLFGTILHSYRLEVAEDDSKLWRHWP